MNESVITKQNEINNSVAFNAWLNGSIKSWVAVILIGQWMFAVYIMAQFSLPWILGLLDESQFSHMIRGYRNGELFNNLMLMLHVIPVMIISLSATFQFFPNIRSQYPRFHRWNGRVFLFLGFCGAITGLYLTWGIGSRLSDIGALGVTLNGILIPIFVYLAWRSAVQRDFRLHRRFAVHAFILINGVWSVRLYLMAWFMINQGPYGNTSKIDGPADIAISFSSFLLPMAVAELVFWSERARSNKAVIIAATAVSLSALLTLLGVFAASTMMWIPRINAVLL